METKNYRITKPRPIGGRMRKEGEIVGLTAREYAAEAGWGGLEEVRPDPVAPAPAKAAEPTETTSAAIDAEASADAPAAAKKRK